MADMTPNHELVLKGSVGETRFYSPHVANSTCKEKEKQESEFMVSISETLFDCKPAGMGNVSLHGNCFSNNKTYMHTKCSLAYLATCMEIPWFSSRFQFHVDVDISDALVVLRSLSALTEAQRTVLSGGD